ncbi:hypothetical protein HanXRQr2_Chr02g0058801 [Helianthus annuus]|uniref:Uncharacterized protein n=1 Tax=Helianthus annuus TaxID=4232 RepID=A0A9K3JLN8_HELAN|nr:hypothetical protein HanXRQr2_Chr02g0058801 [Helianthus annuus]KAJ0618349.1 hypothetical protein HanHA89_Chr02g0052181 [Helianthus annuus]
MYICYDFMLQVLMSSSKSSGLSEDHDPMVVVSDDEVAPDPEIFTSDTVSDPEMLSEDDDDFQPFALPDFGNDVPIFDNVLAFPLPIHDQLIIGHPDGEHLVEPVPIDTVPLAAVTPKDWPFDDLLDNDLDIFVGDHPVGDQGDGEVDDVAILDIPSPVISVIDISSDSDLHSVADSFESVTSSALHVAGVRAYATDLDDEDAMSAAPPLPSVLPHLLLFTTTSLIQYQHLLIYLPWHHPSHSPLQLFLFLLHLLPTLIALIFPYLPARDTRSPPWGGYFWSAFKI